MTKYLNDCAVLIHAEMKEAIKNHGGFVDRNHALGVILEEVSEAREAMERVQAVYDEYQSAVFMDASFCKLNDIAERLYIHSLELMTEAMQVGAMAKKARNVARRGGGM